MKYPFSAIAFVIFAAFVLFVLGLSFYLGRKAKSAKGYYAAHGQIGWFVNGVAFAGDYLSAASFLGICGLIAFYGYDGFLYSIGYLAGWVVALFVIAEPIKRLGKFTFADALDSRFNSRGIKLAVAISTLVVSTFYLIPQMVGAGALIKPLLGLPEWSGVLMVGTTVTLIVVTAGMVSTTWVQFLKGSLLVIFCFVLTLMILNRGLSTGVPAGSRTMKMESRKSDAVLAEGPAERLDLPAVPKGVLRFVDPRTRATTTWRFNAKAKPLADLVKRKAPPAEWLAALRDKPVDAVLAQTLTTAAGQDALVNGLPQTSDNDLRPVGTIQALPAGPASPSAQATATGPLGPAAFLATLQNSTLVTWTKDTLDEPGGAKTTVYYPVAKSGSDLLLPGGYFKTVTSDKFTDKLDFISLMLALFCGTASLPHILIRYYTVKDQAAARKSTIVGIATIGFFYVLTLFLGLGAMTSGAMDPTNGNMAAPLLARSFNTYLFAFICAIAFTTVLGTVSGLIMAGSGAVAHDLMENFFKIPMDDHKKVLYGKCAAVALGIVAMVLGVLFKNINAAVLVGWAFNIAASANLPALVMLLFWKRTTKQGITASVTVGMLSSLAWVLLSQDCYINVYGVDPKKAWVPFSNPGVLTIPLSFAVLVVVSLLTSGVANAPAAEPALEPAGA